MLTRPAQLLAHASFFSDWLAFKNNLPNLKAVQNKILEKNLSGHPFIKSKKDFFDQPIRDYHSLGELLKSVGQRDVRLQPTSGTGDKEKLIPYTKPFIKELNRGLNPWLFDMAKSYPAILSGKHYWSISWLPTHWRKNGWQLDDFELLPAWKRHLARSLLAVPNEVSKAPTLSSSQFATLAWMVSCEDLTFLSVWSPTFLLQLLELVNLWKEPLSETLKNGKWSLFQDELKFLSPPYHPSQATKLLHGSISSLWPCLALISSWDTSSSSMWAKKLSSLFPEAAFQGKGLWATEGVVSIPFENQIVLSYLSHYYEFMEVKSKNLLAAHELKEGMEVFPVLTCGNGFSRYLMKDRIAVTGFMKSVPLLQFLERDDTFDMVGEKIDAHTFLHLHDELKLAFPDKTWVTAFVVNEKSQKPYYSFVFEGQSAKEELHSYISNFLHQHFHYHLARELGQLGAERIYISQDAFTRYQKYQLDRGMVQGNIKVELATKISSTEELNLFHQSFI